MPVDCGSITLSSAQPATAASTAVPPARSTSIAVSAASGCEVATIAFMEWTVERPARWKLLMGMALVVVMLRDPGGPVFMTHSSGRGQWLVYQTMMRDLQGYRPAEWPDRPPGMPFKVAAFYQFVALPDFR